MKRIAVLVSGGGTNLQALLDAPDLGGASSWSSPTGPGRAGWTAPGRGIATAVVAPADHPDRAAWDGAVLAAVAAADPDLVVLAGFMRVLGPAFPRRFPTLNVHPSLLPAFPGAGAVEQALAWGVKVTGCTVHLVDEQVDHGPVVAQEAVPVLPDDTAATLHARIRAVEHRLLPRCVALLCRDRVKVDGRHVTVLPA